MKIALYPLNKTLQLADGGNLLATLLAGEVQIRSVCRGRGICATCQVNVKGGPGCLSPKTPQEVKTLSLIDGAGPDTRLACQCRVLTDGVVIELPAMVFVEALDDLLALVGDEAVTDYRHPIDGKVLIPKDKIITRSLLQLFKNLTEEVNKVSQ
jgi:ferredoxin